MDIYVGGTFQYRYATGRKGGGRPSGGGSGEAEKRVRNGRGLSDFRLECECRYAEGCGDYVRKRTVGIAKCIGYGGSAVSGGNQGRRDRSAGGTVWRGEGEDYGDRRHLWRQYVDGERCAGGGYCHRPAAERYLWRGYFYGGSAGEWEAQR